jgi:hypothetical protein
VCDFTTRTKRGAGAGTRRHLFCRASIELGSPRQEHGRGPEPPPGKYPDQEGSIMAATSLDEYCSPQGHVTGSYSSPTTAWPALAGRVLASTGLPQPRHLKDSLSSIPTNLHRAVVGVQYAERTACNSLGKTGQPASLSEIAVLRPCDHHYLLRAVCGTTIYRRKMSISDRLLN